MPNVLADDGELLIGIQIVHASAENRIDQALQTASNKNDGIMQSIQTYSGAGGRTNWGRSGAWS